MFYSRGMRKHELTSYCNLVVHFLDKCTTYGITHFSGFVKIGKNPLIRTSGNNFYGAAVWRQI